MDTGRKCGLLCQQRLPYCPLYILNNGNDALAGVIRLPPTGFQTPVSGQPGQFTYSTNASFNCPASCVNPYSGFYLSANGAALNIKDFTSGRVDKSFSNPNFGGLGIHPAPSPHAFFSSPFALSGRRYGATRSFKSAGQEERIEARRTIEKTASIILVR